jgi:hypothetical protein
VQLGDSWKFTLELPAPPPRDGGALARHFPDHCLEVLEAGGSTRLIVRPPSSYAHFVDPLLPAGLEWWGPTPPEMIHLSARRVGPVLVSLSDAWTLYSWSEALQRTPTGHVVVLHVDEHDDLMSPLLTRRAASGWRDPLTGIDVSLDDPGSVAGAVASGAVGKASFIVPLVFSPVEVHFRHLRATADPRIRQRLHEMERRWLTDPIVKGKRPALVPGPTTPEGRPPFVYHSTRYPDLWLADLPFGPVFLHVDCDFFNNRYNGRTDWATNPWDHDPPLADIEEQVERLLSCLDSAGIWPRVADVAVSLSAGFFPAEMWEPVARLLLAGIGRRMEHRS